MQGRAKCLSLDTISNLPLPIIENILCSLPIKEAVRTSILSRNWRYNWTGIPKLVFDEEEMFDGDTSDHGDDWHLIRNLGSLSVVFKTMHGESFQLRSHLMCISLFGTVLFDNSHLPLLCHVLRSSPNLEKITLTMYDGWHDPDKSKLESNMGDCSDIWLQNLKELNISCFDNSRFNNLEGESRFVKLILAKSPVLKKVILEVWFRDADRQLEILRPLLQSPRASPAAEIIVMDSIKPWNDYGYSEGLGVVNL
ncbi:F-box/FBD/LRR-repeat protein-like protein [Tanacetum coccineum]